MHPLDSLIAKELSAVTFVRDYVQFEFEDKGLTAVINPTVIANGKEYSWGDAGYRDELCARIGQAITVASSITGEAIRLEFADGSVISISLRPDDFVGPEAAIFHYPGGMKVWR